MPDEPAPGRFVTRDKAILSASSLRPGAAGTSRTRLPSTTKRASAGLRSNRPSRGRSSDRRPPTSRPTLRLPATGFVVTRLASVSVDSNAAVSRNLTSRGPSSRRSTVALCRPCLLDPDGRSLRAQRHAELDRKRPETPTQCCTVDERPGGRAGYGHRACVDDEVGVPWLLAERPVEPVRELRGSDRAEPVDDRDVLGRPETDVPQQPPARAGVDRSVQGRLEERTRSELAPRHVFLTAGADQPDRVRHAALRDR